MAKKYYLDDQGLIKVLQDLSSSINQKTSSRINVNTTEDPVTGEITHTVENPNNFATTGAVYDYVANQSRKKLTINQQSAVEVPEIGYDVQDNISEYNGTEITQIDLKLVDITDIKKLFI